MSDPESEMDHSAETERLKPEVVKYPSEGGFRYVIYFPTEEDAAKAIRDFWEARSKSGMIQSGLKSGMLVPIKHEAITSGDRTHSYLLRSAAQKEHPGMQYMVEFNGNEGAIRPEGEEALRKLGFIE